MFFAEIHAGEKDTKSLVESSTLIGCALPTKAVGIHRILRREAWFGSEGAKQPDNLLKIVKCRG